MRYLLLGLCLLLPLLSFAQGDIKYKEYSYAELFRMIENEEDSVFKLSDAIVLYNHTTDSLYASANDKIRMTDGEATVFYFDNWPERDSIIIDKELAFKNVQMIPLSLQSKNGKTQLIQAGFHKVRFKKAVNFHNTFAAIFNESTFEQRLTLTGIATKQLTQLLEPYSWAEGDIISSFSTLDITLHKSSIHRIEVALQAKERNRESINIIKSTCQNINLFDGRISLTNYNYNLSDSDFISLTLHSNKSDGIIRGNTIQKTSFIRFENDSKALMRGNRFDESVMVDDDVVNKKIDWNQWLGNYVPWEFYKYETEFDLTRPISPSSLLNNESIQHYQDSIRVANNDAYDYLRTKFFSYYTNYKQSHDTENANLVYIDMKNLETQRLAYLYSLDPSFDKFFTWKINQFLQIFSAYGTRPSRAIIFSVYVILAFALIYLFFPNHWDSHGKNRVMNRYRFFTKYMKQDSGMHEVYLEEKNLELMASEDFKTYMLESEKGIPKFFMATALPLYRWSVAGTKSASWLLSKVDVLKGKWSDTEDSKRGGKSFLLITAFLIALLYDIFIKMLNALMLSINTFTTLGFGEIPIKGLPRYLAIIQGFIGWFMLTIFSVSLISQLLN